MTSKKTLISDSESILEEIISIRRKLHKIPEIGYKENKTALVIEETLSSWGLSFRNKIATTGIVCDIIKDIALPTVALRADIDALPIQEESSVGHCSTHPGMMHACGHDMHTASLLGALKILNSRKSELPVNVRAIFQPAEEAVPGGASTMIKEGALKNCESIFGLHVDPFIETGKIAVKSGAMMASTSLFEIKVIGKGGHAAAPFKTIDPIPVAAQIVTAVQSIVSRMISPFTPAVISITKIESGSAYNIIPATASMMGTARALDKETADRIPELLERTVEKIAEAAGAEYEFVYTLGTTVLVNDAKMTAHVTSVCDELLGENSLDKYEGTFGGEDFADYLNLIPGCFFRIGCWDGKSEKIPLHNSRFNPDERALLYGAATLAGIVLNYK